MDRNEFIMKNIKLVSYVAKKYLSQNTSYEFSELFSVGCIGLIKAVDRFNPDYGAKFATFAVPTINGEIKRFLLENNEIHIPRRTSAKFRTILYEDNHSIKEHSKKEIEEAFFNIYPYSLDIERQFDDNSPFTLKDMLKDDCNIEDEAIISIYKSKLKNYIQKLSPIERKAINMYYFQYKTQKEIGEELNIKQVTAGRKIKSAICHLREMYGVGA